MLLRITSRPAEHCPLTPSKCLQLSTKFSKLFKQNSGDVLCLRNHSTHTWTLQQLALSYIREEFCHPSPLHSTLDCLPVSPEVAMTTKALTRETDTHEHTVASRSGHTTIWLESVSKFGPFTTPYMARARERLLRPPSAYLTVCVCVFDVIWLCVGAKAKSFSRCTSFILHTGFIQLFAE